MTLADYYRFLQFRCNISNLLCHFNNGTKEMLRARLFQKVKESKINYPRDTFGSEALQVFFALDDFVLYILLCSDKEQTLKETFIKAKLKLLDDVAIFILPTILLYRRSVGN